MPRTRPPAVPGAPPRDVPVPADLGVVRHAGGGGAVREAEDGMSDVASPAYVSICSGGGGLDLGVRLALPDARCVLYVEREIVAAAVLAKGIAAGLLDDAPIWSDIFTFDPRPWRGKVDCLIGGIPCQPHSYAGKRLGDADERDLWPVTARLVHDLSPGWCFFENVPGILRDYWRRIRPDLQALGYEVTEGIFSAEEVGAPHLRERLFWLAYRPSVGGRQATWPWGAFGHADGDSAPLADRPGVQPRRQQPARAGETGRSSEALAHRDGDGAGERYGRDSVAAYLGAAQAWRDRTSPQDESADADTGYRSLAD